MRTRIGFFSALVCSAVVLTGNIASGVTASAGSTSVAGSGVTAACPDSPPGTLIVRGSVGQIYVINGGSTRAVTVTGPNGYTLTTTTDSRGGLVVRDVPAPGAYSVAIAGDATSPHVATVADANTPPADDFYASQTMTFDPTGTDRTDGYIVTRDCTKLSYRVQFPGLFDPNTRYHVVITYSGYSPGLRPATPWDEDAFSRYTAAGYAVIGVNMRGSGCSGGSFDVMEPIVALDGYDAIQTIAAQPWVDNIAMVDKSWPGLSQLFVAATRPPALTAIEPGAPVADFYRDLVYPGGIENDGFARVWAQGRDTDNAFPSTNSSVTNVTDGIDKPGVTTDDDDPVCLENQKLRGQNVKTVAAFDAHPFYGSYWKERTAAVDKITVPTLLTVSWQDEQTGARAADALSRFAPGTPVRLIGMNGTHESSEFGRAWALEQEFLCVYLNENCPETRAEYEARDPVTILLEADANVNPREEFTLPTLNTAGPGQAFSIGDDLLPDANPDQSATSSRFTYQPADSKWFEARQDMATFTSPPLTQDVVMAGTGSADLWIAAPATDVDLQVTLGEVRPDGQEMLVQSGWLRASHRALDPDPSLSTPLRPFQTDASASLLAPNTLTPVRVELFPFAHPFRAGSRVRVTVNGPGGAVDGWPWHFASVPGPFDVTIAHDSDHPSSVTLPVLAPDAVTLQPTLPACTSVMWQPCRRVFIVNRTTDAVDAAPGDGVCATVDGDCSVRAAIQEANATPGEASILLTAAHYDLSLTGSDDSGGDLDVTDDLLIEGVGATIDAHQIDRVLEVSAGAHLVLDNTALTGGTVWDSGGGVKVDGCRASAPTVCSNITATDSKFIGNVAIGYGGGAYVGTSAGASTFTRVTMSGNRALVGGGAANSVAVTYDHATFSSNGASYSGGGVYASGATTVSSSLLVSNTAGTAGGGIAADAGIAVTNTVVMTNRVTGAGNGGGILIGAATSASFTSKITGSLFLYNVVGDSTHAGRGGAVRTLKRIPFSWSTAAGNTATAGANRAADTQTGMPAGRFDLGTSAISGPSGGGTNCIGTIATVGGNIASDASCQLLTTSGDRPKTDPKLGPWGDLLAGSPAINTGGTGCPATDLHGTTRPRGTACDVGALEYPN